MMDDLPILIARLGWPTVSARWWTMQELATRLGDPSKKEATEAALLNQLRSRRLEAVSYTNLTLPTLYSV